MLRTYRAITTTAGLTSLALDATVRSLFGSPFVVARDIDGVRTAECLLLVIRKAYVRSSKASIAGNKAVEKIPRSLLFRFSILLLELSSLELLSQLKFLSLLGRGKDTTEGGFLLDFGSLGGRLRYLGRLGLLELHLEGELEFEVVEDDEFEFLTNGSSLAEFKPCSCDAVETIIKSEREI